MIKQKEDKKPEIDLRGTQGNAFYIMGTAKDLHKRLTKMEIELPAWGEIQKDMMSSDYNNLISVFDKHFGDYVDLVY